MARKPVVVIGMGEMGSVFARGLLRLGHPVYPVTRKTGMRKLAKRLPKPRLVLLAVAERDLASTLARMPRSWSKRLALLQNELLPKDYRHLPDVTVISVWFEKKNGQDSKVIIPSPAFGPRAGLLEKALRTLDIPVTRIGSERKMLEALVVKNLYILTSNIAGLKVGGSVGELWTDHQAFARAVADDVLSLQEAMTDTTFERERLIEAMVAAFDGDPAHACMGRSAPARLARALEHADRWGLSVPTLRSVAGEQPLATGT